LTGPPECLSIAFFQRGEPQPLNSVPKPGRATDRWRLWAALIAVAAVVLLAQMPLAGWLAASESWVREHPAAGSLAYLGACTVGSILFMPGSVIGVTAGYLFGLPAGFVLAAAGGALGAIAAFLSARTIGRSWVFAHLSAHPRLRALDRALYQQSFVIVMLSRLSLVIPFSVLNYLFGMTGVRKIPYGVASAIGLIPNMALWAYVGSLARDVGELLSGELDSGPYGRVLVGVGLVALVLVVAVIHRTASRALQARVGE